MRQPKKKKKIAKIKLNLFFNRPKAQKISVFNVKFFVNPPVINYYLKLNN